MRNGTAPHRSRRTSSGRSCICATGSTSTSAAAASPRPPLRSSSCPSHEGHEEHEETLSKCLNVLSSMGPLERVPSYPSCPSCLFLSGDRHETRVALARPGWSVLVPHHCAVVESTRQRHHQ